MPKKQVVDILGFSSALLIGFSLGLIGGGGSILTVPALVYLFGINPVLATAYSLFVVGVTSLVGALAKFKAGLVDLKTALVFAVPSFLAVYATRLLLVPAIPDVVFEGESWLLSKRLLIMVFFALIMLAAAISMIRSNHRKEEQSQPQEFNYFKIIGDGLVVGFLTGFVGAGGGFLIIPALVLLAKLPMKLAVGTSLTIIALKSLIGFVGDIQSGQSIEWGFLVTFTGLAVVGIFIGNFFSKRLKEESLKKVFGWFVLAMSIIILTKEFKVF